MSEKDRALLRERLSLAKDIAAVVGPILVGALLLWLKSEFVTRAEYVAQSDRLQRIEMTLARMEQQQRQLDDHEARIRIIEARR